MGFVHKINSNFQFCTLNSELNKLLCNGYGMYKNRKYTCESLYKINMTGIDSANIFPLVPSVIYIGERKAGTNSMAINIPMAPPIISIIAF